MGHVAARAAASVAASALLAVLRCFFLAPVALLLAWLFLLGTQRWRDDSHWRRFPPDFGCDERRLLDKCTAAQLVYMWAAPAALSLAAVGLLAARAALGRHASHRQGTASAWAGRLLPPRRFWLWWCGGLSAADALAVAAWAAANAAWLSAILRRYWSLIPVFSGGGTPLWLLQLELVAVALGSLLFPNLVLLFLPVSRGSAVLQAAGLSFPDAIRFHRWLGHAVMVVVTAHSLGFWGVWLWQGDWLREALDRGSRVNNLAGGVSFVSGLALWLSSLEAARRASYDLFYKLHHVGFWGFLVAGCCHYSSMFWYFLPGLALYGVDAVYRLRQAVQPGGTGGAEGAGARVLEAAASRGGSLCSLLLEAPRWGAAASGYLWLCVPAVSAHEWHPFEYFAVPAPPPAKAAGARSCGEGGAGAALLVHIKAYDRWTRRLVDLVQQQQQQRGSSGGGAGGGSRGSGDASFAVKVEGPYAELPGAVLGHPEVRARGHGGGGAGAAELPDAIVIVAGGVGVTAAMSLLAELAGAGPALAGRPTLIVWACRRPDELEFLAPRLLAMAGALGLRPDVRLYCTGDPMALEQKPQQQQQQQQQQQAPPPPPPASTFAPATTSGEAPGGRGTGGGGGGSLATTSLCPVVALRSFWCQLGHRLLIHAVCFTGALGAILLVRYYSAVAPAAAGAAPWSTGAAGAAYVAAVTAGILLPGSLALQAALWALRRGGGRGGGAAPAAAAEVGEGLSERLLGEGWDGRNADAAAPCAAAACAAAALAARAPASLAAAPAFAGPAVAGAARWQLLLPGGGAPLSVEVGRPPLDGVVRGWLAAARQLPCALAPPGGERPEPMAVSVYAMGPSRLVADVRLLCDGVNAAGGRGGARLGFVCKTHEL